MEAIYVQWCDAISNQQPWLSESEAIEWAESNNWVNEQVGWVVKETPKYLLLAGERSVYMEETQYGHLLKIPTTWILKRKTLNL